MGKKRLISLALIVVGAALCVGGIFLPALLLIGGPMLTAGLSLMEKTFENKSVIISKDAPEAVAPLAPTAKARNFLRPSVKLDIDVENLPKKSFFAFKNLKYFKKHKELDIPNDPQEVEANAMELPVEMRNEIAKLSEDLAKMNKLAQQLAQNRHSHEDGNKLE